MQVYERYRVELRRFIDHGELDPDSLHQRLVGSYFQESRGPQRASQHMRAVLLAMADLFAHNYRSSPPGSDKVTDDARRFRRVRDWVESVMYDPAMSDEQIYDAFRGGRGILVKATTATNAKAKWTNRMDAVMHFLGGAELAFKTTELGSDVASFGVEVADELKSWYRWLRGRDPGPGYDTTDLTWGMKGSELETHFDTSDERAFALGMKFRSGVFTLSGWTAWYQKPESVLY